MKNVLIHFLFILIVQFNSSHAQTVIIGTQEWMTKNLDVSTFSNGDPIPEAKTNGEWELASKNKQPAWCYYNNDSQYGTKYGKLYNWYAVTDARGLAPLGYHIPSDEEWTILSDYLGGTLIAGKKMKGSYGWKDYNGNEYGNGTNECGFNGLPSGNRYGDGSFSSYPGDYGYWWSSSEFNTDLGNCRSLYFYYDRLSEHNYPKEKGFSVRCLEGFLSPIIPDDGGFEEFAVPPPPQDDDGSEDGDGDFSTPYILIDASFYDHDEIQTVVEQEADFPGGFNEMVKFLNDNLDYPKEAIDSAIRGRVVVRFVVEKTGYITNVFIDTPLVDCKACDREVVRVISKMPAWIPGKNGGKVVRTWVTLPIKFDTE